MLQARRRLAVALAACDPPLVPAVLDLIVLLLPSADAAPGGGFGDASQQGWGIASHVRATLCVSGLVAPWHTGRLTRLSAYDLSTLSVGIFRSLLRVRAPDCPPPHLFFCPPSAFNIIV